MTDNLDVQYQNRVEGRRKAEDEALAAGPEVSLELFSDRREAPESIVKPNARTFTRRRLEDIDSPTLRENQQRLFENYVQGISEFIPEHNLRLYDLEGMFLDPERDSLIEMDPERGPRLSKRARKHRLPDNAVPLPQPDLLESFIQTAPPEVQPEIAASAPVTMDQSLQEAGQILESQFGATPPPEGATFQETGSVNDFLEQITAGAASDAIVNTLILAEDTGEDIRNAQIGTRPDGQPFTVQDGLDVLGLGGKVKIDAKKLETKGGIGTAMARGLSAFLMGAGALKAMTGAGALATTAGSTLTTLDAEQNLANLFNDLAPELKNPVTDFLEADIGDKELTKRVKNVLNDFGLGAMAAGVVRTAKFIKDAPSLKNEIGAIQFHGSGSLFERFELGKVNTGQEAQAFGWGLYFAESKDVAGQYAKSLSNKSLVQKIDSVFGEMGQELEDDIFELFSDPKKISEALDELRDAGVTNAEIRLLRALERDEWLGMSDPALAVDAAMRFPQQFEMSADTLNAIQGIQNIYTVDINDKALATMLDWDAPLMQQTQQVKEAVDVLIKEKNVGATFDRHMLGAEFYDRLKESMGGAQEASKWLDSQGVKGIRYLDQFSRQKGQGTRNTVVFDDGIVNVLEVNGVPVNKAKKREFLESLRNERGSIQLGPEGFEKFVKVLKVEGEELPADLERLRQVEIKGRVVDLPPLSINWRRILTTDDVKETLAGVRKLVEKQIREAAGEKVTFDEVEKLGRSLLAEADEAAYKEILTKDFAQQIRPLFAEQQAVRILTAQSARRLNDLKVAALQGEDVGDELLQQLAVTAQIQGQKQAISANAARLLGQGRIEVGEELFGELKFAETASQMVENLPSDLRDLDAIDLARMLDVFESPDEIATLAEKLNKAPKSSVFMEVWINSLLSGPQTHFVNAFSNSLVALWQIPERLLASAYGTVLGGKGTVPAGEAKAQLWGAIQGVKDGLRLVSHHMKQTLRLQPIDVSDFQKLEVAREPAFTAEAFGLGDTFMGSAVDKLGEVIRTPGKMLMIGDDFYKAVGYRMELHALAYRQAAAEGLTGRDMAKRIYQIIENPPAHLEAKAIDAARYQTFTRELGRVGQAGQQILDEWPAMRLIVPFFRTPSNIIKFTGERTILAPLSKAVRDDLAAGGARRDIALARITSGSMLGLGAMSLAMEGKITGAGPDKKEHRDLLYRKGWQPNSFVWDVDSEDEKLAISLAEGEGFSYNKKDRKLYISFDRADPFGTFFSLAASMYELSAEAAEDEQKTMIGAFTLAASKSVASRTWLKGVGDVIESAQRGDFVHFLQRFSGSMVPSVVKQAMRSSDPRLKDMQSRDPEAFSGAPFRQELAPEWEAVDRIFRGIQANLPGWSESVPARRNLWGDEIVLSGALGPDIVVPFYKNQEKFSPVDDEMMANRVFIGMPEPVIQGVRLTPSEYWRYVIMAGRSARDSLEKEILTSSYRSLSDGPDGGKANFLRSVIYAHRAEAAAKMIQMDPTLKSKFEAGQKQKEINLSPKSSFGGNIPLGK